MIDLFNQASQVETAVVTENLLDGSYRINLRGTSVVARSQAGLLAIGAMVTIAQTSSGPVIVSSGNSTAYTAPVHIIQG